MHLSFCLSTIHPSMDLSYMEILQLHASFALMSPSKAQLNVHTVFHTGHSCVCSHILYPYACELQDVNLLNAHKRRFFHSTLPFLLFFPAECLTLTCSQRKKPSNVNSTPFRPVTPHFIYVNGRIFFFFFNNIIIQTFFSASAVTNTPWGISLKNIRAIPEQPPPSQHYPLHLSNVTRVLQRLWCSTAQECTQTHHKQCKTGTLINNVNSIHE